MVFTVHFQSIVLVFSLIVSSSLTIVITMLG